MTPPGTLLHPIAPRLHVARRTMYIAPHCDVQKILHAGAEGAEAAVGLDMVNEKVVAMTRSRCKHIGDSEKSEGWRAKFEGFGL